VADQGESRADRAQEADPKAQVGGSDPRGVLPSAGAAANWHMGVVTPAAHQLMRDTDYIYPPLEGIRGEQPEQERRRNVGTSGEELQQTGGNWTISPLSSALPIQEIGTVSHQV